MARIRSIKPDFWSSEQVVECSPMARLLFIGIWNFADDGGVHPAKIRRLKMEIFPGDALDDIAVQAMVDELVKVGLLAEFEAQDGKYWHVTGWKKHQRIDKPNLKYPQPSQQIRRTSDESSTNTRGPINDHSPPDTDTDTDTDTETDTETERIRIQKGDSPNPKSKKKSPFRSVTDAILKDTGELLHWHKSASSCKNPVIGPTETDILNVLAAAELALDYGENPSAYFITILREKDWSKISGEYADRGRCRLHEHRRQSNGKVPELDSIIDGIGTGGAE